jgi:Flp pilus assembly protein TadG
VLPVLLTLIIGLISVARAFNTYQTMTRAAREGARMAVLTSCATCGNTSYSNATVRTNYVEPAMAASNLDPSLMSNYSQTAGWLDPADVPPQQCGLTIAFQYPYQFAIPFTSLNLTTITLSTQVQMRLENQPSGATCP